MQGIEDSELKFVLGDRESVGSEHDTASQIWRVGQLRPVRVRLIGGDAELLLRMNIIKISV